MAAARYRAATRDMLVAVPLDVLSAVYHRPSGTTHLLAPPAPEILAALADPATLAELRAALEARFDLRDDAEALAARVDELAAAGLIEVV